MEEINRDMKTNIEVKYRASAASARGSQGQLRHSLLSQCLCWIWMIVTLQHFETALAIELGSSLAELIVSTMCLLLGCLHPHTHPCVPQSTPPTHSTQGKPNAEVQCFQRVHCPSCIGIQVRGKSS